MASRSVLQRSDGTAGDAGKQPLFLRRLSRFAELGPVEREALEATLNRPVQFPTHGDLVIEGVATASCYAVERGWACSYKLLRDGKRQILAFLLPGDLIAQHDTDVDSPTCSVSALTPVVVRQCHALDLAAARDRYRPVRQALDGARQLDMATLRDHLVNIGRRNAYQRLAYLILELDYRLRMVGLADAYSFDLPITQEMVADALGLSNVHVNRTLRRLSDDHVACLSGDRLTILDRHALNEIAEFDESYLGQLAKQQRPADRRHHATAPAPLRRWTNRRGATPDALVANAGEPS